MARVKGSGFVELRLFLEARGGGAARARMRELLSPADAACVDEGLPVAWYPLGAAVRAVAASGPAVGLSVSDGARELGRFSAEFELTRIHRIFFRLANPTYVFEKASEYWHRFFDSGSWRVTRESPRRMRAELRDFGAVDAIYCEFLVAYIVRMLELVGARDVRMTHPRCRARGDDVCAFVGEWR